MPRKLTCVAALAVAAAGLLTQAGTASAATTSPPSPHRLLVLAGVSGSTTTTANGDLVSFDSTGTGTWLGHGKVDFEVKGTLDPRPACPRFSGTETLTLHGTTDSLTGTVTGFGCPQIFAPKVLNVWATDVVTGGAGQFAGASGGWGVGGTFNEQTGAFSHALVGVVIVPASSS
jgi:hypothetical protein